MCGLISNALKDDKLISYHRGINEGRQAAREVDLYLENYTSLPVTGGIIKHTYHEISSVAGQGVVAA